MDLLLFLYQMICMTVLSNEIKHHQIIDGIFSVKITIQQIKSYFTRGMTFLEKFIF